MVDESQRYNLSAVRDLLLDAFNAEELRQLFYFAQTPELREIPDQFAEGDSLSAMVRKAVRYCDSRFLMGEMLAEVKAANPRAYERCEALLEASPAPEPAPVHTPAPAPAHTSIAAPGAAVARGATPTRVLGRIPVWGLVAAAVVVVALAVVLVLLLGGPGPEPEPTPTEQALVTDTPTESAVTDAPEAACIPRPIVTSTLPLTPTSGSDLQFIVVYEGAYGVSMRSGAGTSCQKVHDLHYGDQLLVKDPPEEQGLMRWWPVEVWPVGETGWVAEWTEDGTRQIRPLMALDDLVIVENSLDWEGVDPDCQNRLEVEVGTELTVVGLPDPTKCRDPDGAITGMGRQWWLVETPEGWQGWVPDFSPYDLGPEVPVNRVKPLYVVPLWYRELTAPRGSTVW